MHILWADDPAGLALFRPVHVGTMYIVRVVNPGAVALVRCSQGGIKDLFSRSLRAKKKQQRQSTQTYTKRETFLAFIHLPCPTCFRVVPVVLNLRQEGGVSLLRGGGQPLQR